MLTQKRVLDILKSHKKSFSKEFGITELGIFGSLARNDSNDKSDVDVVVKMVKPDLFYLVHIKEKLQQSCHAEVDVVNYRDNMNSLLKKRIDKEAIYV